jgi:clathrin heavy chain
VYSVAMKASQPPMDSHAACFATVTIDGRAAPSNLFCFTKVTAAGPRLNIIEVGVEKDQAFTQSCAIKMEAGDFPVSMLPHNKHGCVFLITKNGLLYVYEIQSGKCLFAQKVSPVTMFVSCEVDPDQKGGVVAIDQKGRAAHWYVDEAQLVNYIAGVMNDLELAVQMARRFNLTGGGSLFTELFKRQMAAGQIEQAMNLAATSPRDVLRTLDTINALKAAGGTSLLTYFQLLLKAGKLNAIESIELATPVLRKNPAAGLEHIKNWLKEAKLEPSEEFGDLLKTYDMQLALSVYIRAKVPEKTIGCFLTMAAQETDEKKAVEHLQNILNYAERAPFSPDYAILIQQLMRVNRDRAKDFALILLHQERPKLDMTSTVDMFQHSGDVKNTTAILLDYLRPRGDQPEDGAFQTRLLEINLLSNPSIADVIMDSPECKFTHYDKLKIAQLCERAGLFQRALEAYTDLVDIKRVLANTHAIDPNFLLEFFGRMTPTNCIDCLRDLLRFNLTANLRLVVEVAKKWNDYLTPDALLALFEEFKSYNGIYFYLGSFVNFTDKKNVVFKYIEAATKLNQTKEVERVCRENEHFDAKEVKEFLLSQNLKDPRPLIHVCDRFDFVEELTQYLYNNSLFMFIEAYVQRMNPRAAPPVVGALLDLNAPEEQIRKLLDSVRPPTDAPDFIEKLVAAVEKRNRAPKILKGWLERAADGNDNPAIHNGLAKIYVDLNASPATFLTTNKHYDSLVVGKYCEARDPHLAFIAYKRAWGTCDNELVDVTNKNGFFKDQARYLVERQNPELWAKVLDEKNEFRRPLIDQVVATALPESRVPEEVSNTVKAFMNANLPNELIELLERIILHGPADGEFQTNKNLQNLLILTAIKADKKRVMDYIKRLDNYDGPDIAKIAVSEQYKLYEEAFFIYKKFKKGAESILVLLENLGSIERATEFAEFWDQPETWSILGKAQLDAGMVREAIKSFLKSEDSAHYTEVITAAKHLEFFDELVSYLRMARGRVKEPVVDNEIIYCFAKTKKLADMEEFITQPNNANFCNPM